MNDDDKNFQRARSNDQKSKRREDILSAARIHLADVGFEKFSMGPLAKAAGLARATLYLYFPSREEVLLELYLESAKAFIEAIEHTTTPGMSTTEFLEAFYDISIQTPLFLELAPRLSATIEVNVSTPSLIAAKRMSAELAQTLYAHTAKVFSLSFEHSVTVFTGIFALLIGTVQITKRPAIDLDALPEDVRATILGIDGKSLFVTSGDLMLKGIQQ